ncbi:MAG TPA: MFS transporter [Caldilineaceae bacterium]|nr:MFS transporter [Caldilineaceae bacterium]
MQLGFISLPTIPRFTRNVNLLLAATAILAVSFFGVTALLKILYILRLGYGPEYVGLFSASGALGYMGMSLPSGWMGERWGMSRVMALGALTTTVGMVMLPLTEAMPLWAQMGWPIVSQIVQAGGYAMFSINFVPALMAATLPENRNSAYALSSTLRSCGTFLGTISGGLLPRLLAAMVGQGLDSPVPYRLGLWIGPVIAVLAIIPLLRIREQGTVAANVESVPTGGFPTLSVALLILFVSLSQAASATCQAFCNAYMDTELTLSPSTIGLIMGVGQFAAIFGPMVLPRMARLRGNGWTLLVITLGSGLSLTPLIFFPHWLGAGMGIVGTLILAAMWMPTLQVYQMEMIAPRWRSLAYGTVSMAMGLNFALISYGGGYVVAGLSYATLFGVGLLLSVGGAGLMGVLVRKPGLIAAVPPRPAVVAGD